MDDLKKKFACPPDKYAMYPIIHSGVETAEARIAEWKQQGFGGIVANVGYTLDYPEDVQAWDRLEAGMRAAAREGFTLWIYDEKGYPSGTAGGAVLEAHPEYETTGILAYNYWKTLTGPARYRADTPEGKLFKALLVPLAGEDEPLDITETADAAGTLRFTIPKGGHRLLVLVERRLFDGTHAAHSYSEPRRYLNLLDPKATDAFIQMTHGKYRERIGDLFGKEMKAFFTDEPSLISWNLEHVPYALVSWRGDFPHVFRERYGYGIELALVAVFLNTGNAIVRRRCDFWEFISTELAENFFGRIQQWCRANGVAASGHLLAEEELTAHIFLYGSFYASMRRFDIPGIDQLESEPDKLMSAERLPIGRLAASFADVHGFGEAMSEASDHVSRMNNRQIPFEWIRASMNWHHAQGINIITSYYNFSHLSRQEVQMLNTYTARLGLMLRQGKRDSRVAILYPECAIWSEITPVPEARGGRQTLAAQEISRIFRDISWGLLHRQVDYDYIDETVIQQASVRDGRLTFGNRAYEAVILPGVHVMQVKTARALAAFMEAGGKVAALEKLPCHSREGTAEADGEVRSLFAARMNDPGHLLFSDLPGTLLTPAILAFLPRIMRLSPADIYSVTVGAAGTIVKTGGDVPSPGILSHMRIREDGRRVILLANMTGKAYRGTLTVEGMPDRAMSSEPAAQCTIWDPVDGSVAPCEWTGQEGIADMRGIKVSLGAYAGSLYVI